MLTVQQLADAVPQNVWGIALATIVAYFALRAFCNVDRALKKLYPVVLLSGAYYRFAYTDATQTHSVLLDALQQLRAKTPQLEAALGDLVVVTLTLHVVVAALDTLRKSRYVSKKNVLNVIGGSAVRVMKSLPFVSGKLADEIKKIEAQIEHSLKGDAAHQSMGKIYALPATGMADSKLLALMKTLAGDADKKWQDGRVSGAVYHGEQDHLDVLNQAYALFSVSNPLHADIWPAVGKFEAEVIAMTASLMTSRADSDVCGTLSSGGTESIFLATKTHREYYKQKHGITQPEIIACVTAHAAIDKACEILGIKLIKVPVNPQTLQIDLQAVKWNISANTIMLYSSAPNFPHGIIDDVAALSAIAVANDVGLHVDCCLGGFILPFAKKLRLDIPAFDFDLPGVTSMSCDTHKYGYASKGTSVVLYKNKALRRCQYFAYPDWTGGLYVTPTLAGSRPGALSAAAWASMMRLGYDGFLKNTEQILETAELIKRGIQHIDGLYVLGDPLVMVICFGGKPGVNILKVSDAMAKQGWSLNALQHPASVHLCVTVRHIGKAPMFLQALADAVDVVKSDPNSALEGGSAIYGMASSMPAGPVDDILRIYTDVTLKV